MQKGTLAYRLAKKYGDMRKKKYLRSNPHALNEEIQLNEDMHEFAERFRDKNLMEAVKELISPGPPSHATPATCPEDIYRKLHNKMIQIFGDEMTSDFELVHLDRGCLNPDSYSRALGAYKDPDTFITVLDIELNGHKKGNKIPVTYTTLWRRRPETAD